MKGAVQGHTHKSALSLEFPLARDRFLRGLGRLGQ